MGSGGYYFVYKLNNKKKIKNDLDAKLNMWFRDVKNKIREL
jgi:predicted transcriptional regulator